VSDPLWMREDWKADSLKWRGEVLKGEYAHWCNEWDGLPVDETTPEFLACLCWEASPKLEAVTRECVRIQSAPRSGT
jgi:hypothetical protein